MRTTKKILIEQSDSCGNPITVLDAQKLNYVQMSSRPSDFSWNTYCVKVISGKTFYKKKDGSQSPVANQNTNNSNSFTKYIGGYSLDTPNTKINFIEKNSNLYFVWPSSVANLEIKLDKISETNFVNRTSGQEVNVEFKMNTQGEVTGGKLVANFVLGPVTKTIDSLFSKIDSSTPSNSSESNFEWREVAKDVWDELKRLGRRVGEEAGKLYAWISREEEIRLMSKKWECVSKFLEIGNYYPLTKPFPPLDKKFRTMDWSYTHDGKETTLKLNSDDTFEVIFTDGSYSVINGLTGKWGCGSDGKSFFLTFQNGKTKSFGGAVPYEEEGSGTQNSNVQNLQSFSESCPTVKACPSVDDVEKKGKAFKLCMKCDEIKKLQNTPQFKLLYFSRLKDNGKPEVIDGEFGPIMKAAVEDYQLTNGIKKTGMIGPITYKSMMNDKEPVQTTSTTPSTTPPKQPQVVQPNTPDVGEVEIEVATEKTKF